MNPHVSFCIATYKKPTFLHETLGAIQNQTESNFEVIISDNDPERSSESVVTAFKDSRFKYFANSENVGMIKNFNRAIGHAAGDYIILNTDDDPPRPHFLKTLYTMETEFPNYGCYFGAIEILIKDERSRKIWGLPERLAPQFGPWPENESKTFSKDEFPVHYFKNEVFPSVLWSAGMIQREIVEKIGGIPDFGSPECADGFYTILAGMEKGFVARNELVSELVIHGKNSSLSHVKTLENLATDGYSLMRGHFKGHSHEAELIPLLNRYVQNSITNKATYVEILGNLGNSERKDLREMMTRILNLPHIQPAKKRYLIRRFLMTHPPLYQIYHWLTGKQ